MFKMNNGDIGKKRLYSSEDQGSVISDQIYFLKHRGHYSRKEVRYIQISKGLFSLSSVNNS